MKTLWLMAVVALTCLGGVVRADVINGDFSSFTGVLPDGWTTYEGAMEYTALSPDGSGLTLSPFGRLGQQPVGQPLVAGNLYTVSFLLASPQPQFHSEQFLIRFFDLDNGNELLGSLDIDTTGLTTAWVPFSFSFTPAAVNNGHNWWLYANSYNGVTGLDNLHVTQAPEPSTVAMLGFGLLGLLFCAWRRRK